MGEKYQKTTSACSSLWRKKIIDAGISGDRKRKKKYLEDGGKDTFQFQHM